MPRAARSALALASGWVLLASCGSTGGGSSPSAGQGPPPAPAVGEHGGPRPECDAPAPVEDAWPISVVEPGWSTPERLPSPLNTGCVEDCPEISPDGTSLFLCWQDRVYGSSDEEIGALLLNPAIGTYGSRRDGAGWTPPAFEDLGVGAPWSIDMSTARSADGQLVVFHSAREGNESPIELYRASRQGGAWAPARRLPSNVNAAEAGEAGVSPDGRAVIFASRRPGGLGGQDLWVSYLVGSDEWSEPENLGAPINSPFDELMAFVRADGREMYFNSRGDGHPASGVYRAAHTGAGGWGAGAWTDPVYVLTGAVGEASVTADGASLYFAHAYLSSTGRILDVDVFVIHR